MSILNQYSDQLAKACDMQRKMSEHELAEAKAREEHYRLAGVAREAVLILNFILNPTQSSSMGASLYGRPSSDLAKKICDLCMEAISEARDS